MLDPLPVKLLSVGEEGFISSKVREDKGRYSVREGAVRGVAS